MNTAQLELTLEGYRACRSIERRHYRRSRARQWFERMREVVDRAPDFPVRRRSSARTQEDSVDLAAA